MINVSFILVVCLTCVRHELLCSYMIDADSHYFFNPNMNTYYNSPSERASVSGASNHGAVNPRSLQLDLSGTSATPAYSHWNIGASLAMEQQQGTWNRALSVATPSRTTVFRRLPTLETGHPH